jgi:hypothetical protein
MTLQFLRLLTGATIAAAIISALALAVTGAELEGRPARSSPASRAQPGPLSLPVEPSAAGPALSASAPVH